MFCPKCGSKNDNNAAFCSSCGEKLNAPQTTETAKASVLNDGSSKKHVRLIGVILLCLVIGGGVLWLCFGPIGVLGNGERNANESDHGALSISQVQIKDSVDAYSWNELSAIATEISEAVDEASAIEVAKRYKLTAEDGKLDGSQTKSIMLSDGANIDVQIVGFYHDDKTSGGKAGITFIFRDAIAQHEMNLGDSNSGGWEGSQMRTWLTLDGMNMLPDDLKNALVEVNKRTNNIGKTENTASVSTTPDKLWLFSVTELCGKVNFAYSPSGYENSILNSEGTEYKLFFDMSVESKASNDVLIKDFEDDIDSWWGRSPDPTSSVRFSYVSTSGNPYSSVGASESKGVVPGFCI